jgi:hypothetical protein
VESKVVRIDVTVRRRLDPVWFYLFHYIIFREIYPHLCIISMSPVIPYIGKFVVCLSSFIILACSCLLCPMDRDRAVSLCACCVIPVSSGYVNQNPFPCIALRLAVCGTTE